MITSERIFVIVGALVMVLLQLFVAPYIAVAGIAPNFLLAYAIAIAIVRTSSAGCLLPFLLGLFFDFVGGGPVGAMALVLMAVSALSARCFQLVDNDSLFMAIAMVAFGVLLSEAAYGFILLGFGFQASLPDVLIMRVFPCALYDFIVSLILFLLVRRRARPSVATRVELTQLR